MLAVDDNTSLRKAWIWLNIDVVQHRAVRISNVTSWENVTSSISPNMQAKEEELLLQVKSNTAINSVYYQWVRRGLSQFAEGTATN